MYKHQRVGVDFHAWDGIYQGSRSHVLGIYKATIVLAPDIVFYFFLHDLNGLVAEHPVFSQPNVRLIQSRRLPSWLRLTIQLPWLALRHRIDVLHMQYRLPAWTGSKTVCTVHDLLYESHPAYFRWTFILMAKITHFFAVRFSNALLTVSQFSKSELCKRHQIAADKVGVTLNGVDQQRFYPSFANCYTKTQENVDMSILQQWGLMPGQYILTVGRLEPRKNQAHLIRAWGQLAADSPPLVVVGQPDFSFIDVYLAQKEVNRPVKFLNKVKDNELPALMRHARLFAYPAFAEGFGMPVIEALASGVLVLTSNTTALPEVAGPGAILVDPTQVSSIKAGLEAGLALTQAERNSKIAAGLFHVNRFNWDDSARVLIEHLRGLLNSA